MTNSITARKFEKVSKYKNIKLPIRATRFSDDTPQTPRFNEEI